MGFVVVGDALVPILDCSHEIYHSVDVDGGVNETFTFCQNKDYCRLQLSTLSQLSQRKNVKVETVDLHKLPFGFFADFKRLGDYFKHEALTD